MERGGDSRWSPTSHDVHIASACGCVAAPAASSGATPQCAHNRHRPNIGDPGTTFNAITIFNAIITAATSPTTTTTTNYLSLTTNYHHHRPTAPMMVDDTTSSTTSSSSSMPITSPLAISESTTTCRLRNLRAREGGPEGSPVVVAFIRPIEKRVKLLQVASRSTNSSVKTPRQT
ncbi:hypothetical protein TSOC_008749 [Tetrabaena socialis]|uniref:Uncharacterized protein n=1 Tax=Tetrabaena socialis TaxID=47790 RepID=A0A2J7ZXM2_9CHLO|nr:hypothetical protein TSOC_008749 [Tetrabaena socialis]|eukprot:PNH05024.1 hypothetical protein TSOC_008749 [Tetrabaena socialis]